ncbi:MAG TPA: delta-60 repeat domain-containing protein [Chthoniobacterales bacterium]
MKTAKLIRADKNFSGNCRVAALPRSSRVRRLLSRRPSIVVAVTVLAFIASTGAAEAAAGRLDPAFGTRGKVTTDFSQTSDLANAVALQADGKIIVVGQTYANNDYSNEDFAVVRYNANGTLDNTFGVNGRVTTDFPGLAAVASSVVVQADGKIVVAGGAFPFFTFAGNFEIVRYNSNGSLDTSFGNGGIVETNFPAGSYAFAVALQSDGKIIAAGTYYANFNPGDQSDTDFALARYNPDGSPDTSFGTGGQVTTDFSGHEDDAYSVLLQSDGKIVVVGSANSTANYYDFAAARYLSNGTLDTSFGTSGKVTTDFGDHNLDIAYSAALQSDGKIVAAGTATLNGGTNQFFGVARFNSNGTLDTSFRTTGKTTVDFGNFLQGAYQVLIQSDGKILTVGASNGESSEDDFLLARLNTNGSLDRMFGKRGTTRTSFGPLNDGASGAALQPDGNIVAVGFTAIPNSFPDMAMARYLGQ